MGIIAWIILGAFSGWIASIIMNKNASMGAIANIVTGIIGAFIGGIVFNNIYQFISHFYKWEMNCFSLVFY